MEENGVYKLLKAKDKNKDQSYFLCQLNQKQLSKVMFPLADLEKPEIRRIAEEEGFVTAKKKDSTGICFIGERKFREFLKGYIPAKPGVIKSVINGEVLGKHDGLMYYTLGQRRGLNIGGKSGFAPARWFVVEKDLANNTLWVDQGDSAKLYSNALECDKFSWIAGKPEVDEIKCNAKFRYRQPDQGVTVRVNGDGIYVAFDKPQRAVTPVQFVVLYDGEVCLGGGVIERVIK